MERAPQRAPSTRQSKRLREKVKPVKDGESKENKPHEDGNAENEGNAVPESLSAQENRKITLRLHNVHAVCLDGSVDCSKDYKISTIHLSIEKEMRCSLMDLEKRRAPAFIYIRRFGGQLYLFADDNPGKPVSRDRSFTYIAECAPTKLFMGPYLKDTRSSSYPLRFTAELTDDDRLSINVYLKQNKVYPDLGDILSGEFDGVFGAYGAQLAATFRALDFADDDNVFCQTHKHVNGACDADHPHLTKLTDDFEAFFDSIRESRPTIANYALRTESLSARLRPYQRESVRFMIDRELHPEIGFDLNKYFKSVEIETDKGPIYYLPNLGVCCAQDPSKDLPPPLSLCGGILADEMGLGKTVEVLTLVMSVTPEHTPSIEKTTVDDDDEIDEVRDVVNSIISSVVASVDGEMGKRALEKRGKAFVISTDPLLDEIIPNRLTERLQAVGPLINCAECGMSCAHKSVHWSKKLSAKHTFLCPECVAALDEPIPIRATLIIVPNAIVHQWYEEIKRHVKDTVSIDIYRGTAVDGFKHPYYLNQFDVVVTTYEVMAKERKFRRPAAITPKSGEKRILERIKDTPLYSINWWRICLDESQMVGRSVLSIMCSDLHARARWCVSGTPFTTSVNDLQGLLYFLDLTPINWPRIFERLLFNPYACGHASRSLIDLVSKFMWRTAKKHITSSLPTVTRHMELVTLSPVEERLYNDLLRKMDSEMRECLENVPKHLALSSLSRQQAGQLTQALTIARLFLLTTENLKAKRNGAGFVKVDEVLNDDVFLAATLRKHTPYSPENMYLRLMETNREEVVSVLRDRIKYTTRMAGVSRALSTCPTFNLREALRYYKEAADLILATAQLNEFMGMQPATVVVSIDDGEQTKKNNKKSSRDDEEKMDVDSQTNGGEMGDGEVVVRHAHGLDLKPITCSAKQIVHLYKNLTWALAEDLHELSPPLAGLAVACSSLVDTLRPIYRDAYRSYTRVENRQLAKRLADWYSLKEKLPFKDSPSCCDYIGRLCELASRAMANDRSLFKALRRSIIQSTFLDFANADELIAWTKKAFEEMVGVAETFSTMISHSLQVAMLDGDADDAYSEADVAVVYGVRNGGKVSKQDDDYEEDFEEEEEEVGGREDGDKEEERENIEDNGEESKNVDADVSKATNTLESARRLTYAGVDELLQSALVCEDKGYYRANEAKTTSPASCVICATATVAECFADRNTHERSKRNKKNSQPRRVLFIINELFAAVTRDDSLLPDMVASLDLGEKKACDEALEAFCELPKQWQSIHMAALNKIYRVRELRQCTERAGRNESARGLVKLAGKTEYKLSRATKAYTKAVANLRYASTLKSELGADAVRGTTTVADAAGSGATSGNQTVADAAGSAATSGNQTVADAAGSAATSGNQTVADAATSCNQTAPKVRECPICLMEIGESWMVLPCAHYTCDLCYVGLKKMSAGEREIKCTVCREPCDKRLVMLVNSKLAERRKRPLDDSIAKHRLSAKFEAIVRRIDAILKADPNEKIIVFTSEAYGLASIMSVFERCDLPFVALAPGAKPHAVFAAFNNKPAKRVLLMQYRSGAKGVNLTVANHIIFADPIEDTSMERQAIGRCDRMGQMRPVHVYHVLAQATVDERIYRMARDVEDTSPIDASTASMEGMKSDEWTIGMFLALFNSDHAQEE